MQPEARRWLVDLPPALARHARLLKVLAESVEADERIRVLVVGCSVGRGTADEFSDLDMNMGIALDAWPAFLEDVDAFVRRSGEVVDILHHRIAELGQLPHQRTYAVYRDGVQLDLVMQPISAWSRGRTPDMVVLCDRDGVASRVVEPSNLRASAGDVREWTFLAWVALANCVKYIRRASLWEALESLHEVRRQIWRLWAVSKGVRQPVYGLTAILDAPGTELPPGIGSIAPRPDREEIVAAALTCAAILNRASSSAMAAVGVSPRPLLISDWVLSQLGNL